MHFSIVQLLGPEIIVFLIVGGLALVVITTVAAAMINFIFKIVRRNVSEPQQGNILARLIAAVDTPRLVLVIGFIITLVFGLPSFVIAFYSGSMELERQNAMSILKWLLGGWGFGSGVSLLSIVRSSKKVANS